MTITRGQKANLDTLICAAKNGDLALMEVKDAKTGELYDAVCAVSRADNGEYVFSPIAVMLRENPYERLRPPRPDGGFDSTNEPREEN